MRSGTAGGLAACALGVLVQVSSPMAQDSTHLPLLEGIPPAAGHSVAMRGDTLLLTFDQAMARVLEGNPSLQEAKARIAVGVGLRHQATAYPNPELGLDVEDFARQSADGPSQTTIGISQTIPLWGKRSARGAQADQELLVARADASGSMMELYREAASSFAALLGAQQSAGHARERLRLAQELESVVDIKVKEGAVSTSELLRARSSTALARVDVLRAQSEEKRAQSALTSLWSDTVHQPVEAVGTLDFVEGLPRVDTLFALLDHHPELQARRASVQAREAELGLAKALGRPDPTIGVGYRRLHDANDNAIIAGVSFPLPLFDRNKGNVQALAAQVEEASAALKSSEFHLRAELTDLWTQLGAQTQEVGELRDHVLPAIQQSLEQIDQAYRLGRQPYINVLDAQRTQAEIQSRLVEVMVRRAQTQAAIEGLIGQRFDQLRRDGT